MTCEQTCNDIGDMPWLEYYLQESVDIQDYISEDDLLSLRKDNNENVVARIRGARERRGHFEEHI